MDRIQNVDAVVIQRDWPVNTSTYRQVMQQARQYNKPVIYDLDDLLLDLPITHANYNRYRACRPHIALALAEADLVTCSTATLASTVSAFVPNARVLPNYLPDDLWRPILDQPLPEPTPSQPLCIGYCGGHSHGPDIEMIQPVLLDLLNEFAGQIQLCFWGLRPPPQLLDREDVRWEAVEIGEYVDFVKYFGTQRCDIFLAPLLDSLFNRCKSGLKFLEYSALGIPGIYSRLEPYQELVIHGENGYLATDLSEWDKFLRRLIADPGLRQRMGKAAKESVANHWLLGTHAARWQEKYTDAIDQVATGKRTNQQIPLAVMTAWHDELNDALALSESNNQQKMAEIAAIEERRHAEIAAFEERRRVEMA
ncbi:MAG: glycosyltransferase, partial [Chloroflexi bacterium]